MSLDLLKDIGKRKTAPGEPWLSGQLLLAMPAMADPRFQRAVILVCAHDEKGAMGLVVNQPLPGLKFVQLLNRLQISAEAKEGLEKINIPVMSGGPVENTRGFLLHSAEFEQADTVRVTDGICITGTVDALRAVANGKGPRQMLFVLGYAGWTAGQLDDEIRQNAWLTAPAELDLLFHADPGEKWDRAVSQLGVDPAMLSGMAGRA